MKEELLASISRLRSRYDDQMSYLRSIGHFEENVEIPDHWNIDELGLQFEDVEYVIPVLVENGQLSRSCERTLHKLSKRLVDLSGRNNEDFWTVGALRTDKRWEDIRLMAQRCLQECFDVT